MGEAGRGGPAWFGRPAGPIGPVGPGGLLPIFLFLPLCIRLSHKWHGVYLFRLSKDYAKYETWLIICIAIFDTAIKSSRLF